MSDIGAKGESLCPTKVTLDQFLSGKLPAQENNEVSQHIEGCPLCAVRLVRHSGTEMERLLRASDEALVVSVQEADEILKKISHQSRVRAAGRRGDRRFRFTEREIAKGGMGVVHEGVDTEMGRIVAVKRLNDEHAADLRSIKQFQHEARVTGSLEHPGIVPVYGRGKDPVGRPFFAMRKVEGERLSIAIKRFHELPHDHTKAQEFRRFLSRFILVCNTVAYAHKRGFAHLDLKPSNILLGPFGETFTMDWGLAMRVNRPVHNSFGTADYMSPEQRESRFDEIGPCSDVYSLGGVLYSIVSGRRPSHTQDVAAPGDPAGIPQPLYAICRKAMDHQPKCRYDSPLALADDVERWLADEAVSVVSESFFDRVSRWVRRHRVVALAAILVSLTITIAAIVTTFVVSFARLRENQALMRAESRADLAIEAIREFREAVDENLDIRNRPDLQGLRKRLLNEPLTFFGRLREDLQNNGDMGTKTTLRLGKSNLELALLLAQIDSKPDALRAYQEAIATLSPLEGLSPGTEDTDRHEACVVLVEALGRMGLLQRDFGRVNEARATLNRALEVSSRLTLGLASADDQVIHARTLDRLALIEAPEAPAVAISLLEQAVERLRPIASENLSVPRDPGLLAFIYTHLGNALKAQRRLPEAAERLHSAIASYESLIRESPENHTMRSNLAAACYNLGNLQLRTPESALAKASFERARDLLEQLCQEYPSATLYRANLVTTHGTLGVLHERALRFDQARIALNRSRELGEELVRDHPKVLKYRSDLGRTYINLSVLETQAGRHGDAVNLLRPASEHLREVFHSRPGDRSARDALATACNDLASGFVKLKQFAEALAAYRESVSLQLELVRLSDPENPPNRPILRSGLLGTARCQLHLGRVAEAVQAAEECRTYWDGDHKDLCSIAQEFALCSEATHDTIEARRYGDRAMGLLREAIAAGLRSPEWLRSDPFLAPLRVRADFRALLAELADAVFPVDSFAP